MDYTGTGSCTEAAEEDQRSYAATAVAFNKTTEDKSQGGTSSQESSLKDLCCTVAKDASS